MKKTINLLLLASALTLAISGCNQSKESKSDEDFVYQIKIESLTNNMVDIPLSEIASDINYIPLETNPEVLIGERFYAKTTKSYLFVWEENHLLQFTNEGKYIRQIGDKGRGPGEYIGIMNVLVNEFGNMILVLDQYQALLYDTMGNSINIPSYITFSFSEFFYHPKRFAGIISNTKDRSHSLIIYNQKLEILNELNNNSRYNFEEGNIFQGYENKLYFMESPISDTVYMLKDDSLLIPHIVYNHKDLPMMEERGYSGDSHVPILTYLENVKDKIFLKQFSESFGYIFTSYQQGNHPYNKKTIYTLYDKARDTIDILIKNGFSNDMDGGFEFWPNKIEDDSIAITWKYPFEIKELVSSDEFKNSTPKYPEKKMELEKLANSLKDDDNLVVIVVKLKK